MKLSDILKTRRVETTGVFKTLDLTDEQYRRLVLAVTLALRIVVRDDEKTEIGLQDIHQYILSYAKQFNSTDLITAETYEDYGDYYTWTDKLRISANDVLDYYKDHVFLSELSDRLALRDFSQIDPNCEKTKTEFEQIRSDYFNEFDENDVMNLQLVKQSL